MYTFNISKNPKKIKINLNKKYTYSTLKIYISNFFCVLLVWRFLLFSCRQEKLEIIEIGLTNQSYNLLYFWLDFFREKIEWYFSKRNTNSDCNSNGKQLGLLLKNSSRYSNETANLLFKTTFTCGTNDKINGLWGNSKDCSTDKIDLSYRILSYFSWYTII